MSDSSIWFFLEKLTNLAIQEASLFGEVEEQITMLCNELQWMRLFLRLASANCTVDDERISLWVNQMRDVCFDAEDVVDEFMFRMDSMCLQRLIKFKCPRPLAACIRFCEKLLFAHDVKARMEKINMAVEKILVNKTRYSVEDLIPKFGDENRRALVPWRFSKEEDLPVEKLRAPDRNVEEVGFAEMQERVKNMLIKEESEKGVVSIWGMGGLGKTTLARRVYNDSHVKQHFDCRAWVSVSQEYSIGELLMRIAISVTTLTPQHKRTVNENELGNKLRDCLISKTYLIVLDDLCSPQVLDVLSSHFPPSNRSRVLITTRDLDVSQHAPTHQVYVMRQLNRVDSWERFLQKVYRVTTTQHMKVQSDLQKLKEDVVDKCQGSPFTIALLGGLLSRKQKTQGSWDPVLEGIKGHGDGQPFYLLVLSWSYNSLPFYLKSCFLYCGLFPEDNEINTRKLMNLWIAEGFVPKRGEETPEEAADDCLEELIQRGLIHVGKRRLEGGVKSCYIHDQARNFIISEARNSKFFEVCKKIHFTSPLSPRRLSFHHHVINNNTSQHLNSSHLRSLICFSTECLGKKSLDSLIQGSKLLTVLDLEGLRGINELPRKIGHLIHLKYLSLRRSSITRLRKSIGKLVNLETLDLRDSVKEKIPHAIGKLRQLKQLYVSTGMVFSSSMGVGQLTNLQTLNTWKDGFLKDGDLGKLTQLRKLRIHSSTGLNLELMSLSDHTYLYKVFLTGKLNKLPEETLFYPPNLMELILSCSGLDENSMPILQALPNLRNLELLSSSYVGRNMVCSSNGFLRLESLTLSGLRKLKKLSLEEGAMPGLRSLKIKECRKMKGLLRGLLHLKNLQQIKLKWINPRLIEEFENTEGEEFDKIRFITAIIPDFRDIA